MAADPQQARWTNAVTLLSLDRIGPLLPEMGLDDVDPVALRDTMREVVVALREAFARDGVTPNDVGRRALVAVESRFGDRAALRFAWWFDVQFAPVSGVVPGWSRWGLVLRHDQSPSRGPVLPWPPALAGRVASAYRNALDLENLRPLLDDHEQRLSDWDLRIYARRGWAPGGSGADPAFEAEQIIETVRLQRFFVLLAPALDETVDAAVHRSALDYLRKLEVEDSPRFLSIRGMVARDFPESAP
ncbi:MAG: hypothetical protein KC731_41265 [Myxococcales bacterium]|nr:hypothetical protein [Myxococcales bacterium]